MASPGDFERQKEDEHSRRPYIWRNDSYMVAVHRDQLSDKKWSATYWFGNSAPNNIGSSNNKEKARQMAVDWMRKKSK
jgi:hypothetical protein